MDSTPGVCYDRGNRLPTNDSYKRVDRENCAEKRLCGVWSPA